jgi:hypothetical protein
MAPTILLQTLESVRRRVRWLTLLTGVGLVLASAIAVLLLVAGLDYLMNLPAFPRTLLDLAALFTLGYTVWHWVLSPLLARLTLNDVAGRVERAYPQFEDRLRSTVDIISGRDVPGSDIMKQRVVSEATRLSNGLDLTRVVVAKPAWYAVSAGGVAILLLASVFEFVDPAYTRTSMARLFTPFANVHWPRAVRIDRVGETPTRVTVGQRIDVAIRLGKGDKPSRKAILYTSYGDASGEHMTAPEEQLMTRGSDGIYRASVDSRTPPDALAGSVRMYVESGDDRLDVTPVKVVQRLSLQRVAAEITAPPYAHLAPVSIVLGGQTPAVMTVGSTVKVTALFSKPLDPAKPIAVDMLGTNSPSPFTWAEPVGNSVVGTMTAVDNIAAATTTGDTAATKIESVRFRLKATDIDGISNPAAEEFELIVKPDQNPKVTIEKPSHNESCTPEAVVPVQAFAEDDFGIATLGLQIDRAGDKKHWGIPLVTGAAAVPACKWVAVDNTAGLQQFRSNYDWDLAALASGPLKPGDVLQCVAVVTDNYLLNGQTHPPVPSGWVQITIISQSQLDEINTTVLNNLAESIASLKQNQASTARQTEALAQDLKDKAKLDDADKAAIARLAAQQGSAAAEASALAQKAADVVARMEENKSPNQDLKATAGDVEKLLKDAAEHPMTDAAGDLNKVPSAANKDDRQQQLSDAKAAEGQAGEKLQKAIDRLGGIGGMSRAISAVGDLLADQKNLSKETAKAGADKVGKDATQLTPAEQKQLDDIAAAQRALEKRAEGVIAQIEKDAKRLDKSDPIGSEAMKQAAETGKAQDVPGKQGKAADAASKNKQSEAQNNQKQAEQSLESMLNDLKEAQTRKLDELARKLSELQKQVGNLIREQAGHNLGDIVLQPRADRAHVKDVTMSQLKVLAELDADAPLPPGDLAMLSAAQEQTERNARDIAKTAEDLPDGAEPADKITRAADKMERAIVNLRENKIVDAYNPPQVDALQSLLDAKKIIDEQKKKADDKKTAQKKEEIKRKFEIILTQQMEVNAVTARIDQTPRVDGVLPRKERQLAVVESKEQGKVADLARSLNDDLAGIGSVVYTYANQEIVSNMGDVRDALAQAGTGPDVQAQEAQIVALLGKMISDLDPKNETSPFAQKGGGKGGGGGEKNKGLPTEAELRLLKDLQTVLNDTTIRLGHAATQPKPQLLSLGNRQEAMRNLLDKLIQKASQGKAQLPPEPKNEDQLPEEASGDPKKAEEKVDDQELDHSLLGGDSSAPVAVKPAHGGPPTTEPAPAEADHDLAVVGDRMARSHQRLAFNYDAGAVTQEIQKRILADLDDLIEQARKKEAEGQNQPPQPDDGDKQNMSKKKPGDAGEPQKTEAQKAQEKADAAAKAAMAKAAGSSPGGGGAAADQASNDLSRDDRQSWGAVSDREREAVTESKNEQPLEKYRKLVDDYYRTMATKKDGQ